jgi:long-chain acyl-CoA synthetase
MIKKVMRSASLTFQERNASDLDDSQFQKAVPINPSDPYSPWQRVDNVRPCIADKCDIVSDLVDIICGDFKTHDAIGYRKIIGKTATKTGNGPMIVKKDLSDVMTWFTNKDMRQMVDRLARGLVMHGVKQGDRVVLFMETRMEWLLTFFAVMKIGGSVATLYATLGEEGIVHAINELEASHLITSNDLLTKLKKLRPQLNHLNKVFYIPDVVNSIVEPCSVTSIEQTDLVSYNDLLRIGSALAGDFDAQVSPEDLAVIMYTSGSTGIPKGVMLTHKNLLEAVKVFNSGFPMRPGVTYISYLPLAHIFELCSSMYAFCVKAKIGYASPLTLLSTSPGLAKRSTCDMEVLKPTVMIGVPLVLDRIRKGIDAQLNSKGRLFNAIFRKVLAYKKKRDTDNIPTPLIDNLIMKKIRNAFGGNLEHFVCGGAPISQETLDFAKTFLGVTVYNGYGATETCAIASVTQKFETTKSTCGCPQPGCQIKLTDWEEGGYRVTDKPNPRGEIIIKSKATSAGYFKRDDLTAESFVKDPDGSYWFITGDIGEILPNGSIRIVDRKKDLVKLQMGEYISLGKVEAELKCCPVIENICVLANGNYNYTIAIVSPNPNTLQTYAKTAKLKDLTVEQLCSNADVQDAVLKEIAAFGKSVGLSKFEIPTKIKLAHETWTPDSGLVTAALKIRRKQIEDFYKDDISIMYS